MTCQSEIRHERYVRYLFSTAVCTASFAMIYLDKLDGWPGVSLITVAMMTAIGAEITKFGRQGIEADYDTEGGDHESK